LPQFINEYRQRECSTSESGPCAPCRFTKPTTLHVFDIGRGEIGFLHTENPYDSAPGPMPDGFPAAIVFLSDLLGFGCVEPRLNLTGGHRDRLFPVVPDLIDTICFIRHKSTIVASMRGNKGLTTPHA